MKIEDESFNYSLVRRIVSFSHAPIPCFNKKNAENQWRNFAPQRMKNCAVKRRTAYRFSLIQAVIMASGLKPMD